MSQHPARLRPVLSLVTATAILVPTVGVATATAAHISAPHTIAAPHVSPVRIPGTTVRRGHRLHGHQVLVYRRLTVHRDTARFTLTCPKGHGLRSIGFNGRVAPNIIGSSDYVGHRSIRLRGDAIDRHKSSTSRGTVYGLCS